jgi:hypothetical protein
MKPLNTIEDYFLICIKLLSKEHVEIYFLIYHVGQLSGASK